MKVTFIGCASSGKTTTAAMVFSELKRNGIVCEFISEQARIYIARKRLSNPKFYPSDEDQIEIMKQQQELIRIMENSTIEAGAIVICDSSPLNALLYMSPEARDSQEVQELIREFEVDPGLTFYSPPVPRNYSVDPNRVHTEAQSLTIDHSIPSVMFKYAPKAWGNKFPLFGESQDRYVYAINEILRERIRRDD